MTKAADEYEDIARRLKELEADRQLALTGTSAPTDGQEPKTEMPYGYSAYMMGHEYDPA